MNNRLTYIVACAHFFVICALIGLQVEGIKGCGEDDVVGDRIVGGSKVVKHSIPWQAGIVFTGENKPFCGGTIIDETHILTAAHCMERCMLGKCTPIEAADIQVLTGEHDTSVPQGETRHNVKAILNHRNYTGQPNYDYDMAILTIDCSEKINLKDKARAACLPKKGDARKYEVSGTKFNVSGWGTFEHQSSDMPNILHAVTVPFVSDKVCKKRYGPKTITDRMICAGDIVNGGIDSCQGDSGGPLTWKDTSSGKWKIVGVVSWGYSCAAKTHPGIYAKVETLLDWVKRKLLSDGNCGTGGGGGSEPNGPDTANPEEPIDDDCDWGDCPPPLPEDCDGGDCQPPLPEDCDGEECPPPLPEDLPFLPDYHHSRRQ